jgi:hypothetical protein
MLYIKLNIQMNVEHWWNDTEWGVAKVLGEKLVPVAL